MAAWLTPMVLNMAALHYLTVETVVVFRNLSTLGVAFGDLIVFKRTFPILAVVSMVVMVIGSVLYGSEDLGFSVVGYFWGFMYTAGVVFNSLYIKLMFNQVSSR